MAPVKETVKVKSQIITDKYCLYNDDCCKVMPKLKSGSIGHSIFSPPFSDLYSYSDDLADIGNNSYSGFMKHFGFVVKELYRLLMPGRVCAIHCMDLPTYKRSGEEIGLRDFSGDLIRLFQEHGFIFHSRHCIWKDPLVAATRTKAIGLAHKQIVKDSAMCRMGIPDYLLAFRKPGENPKPISHPTGLQTYHGSREIPKTLDRFMVPDDEYDGKTDKRSHWIWQKYASPVWDDIRQTKVLQFRAARDEEDTKHICPLQIDVIERCMVLWTAPGDTVLTPFLGIGSEAYVAVKNGRKAIGIELKSRYFRTAVKNVKRAAEMADRRLF